MIERMNLEMDDPVVIKTIRSSLHLPNDPSLRQLTTAGGKIGNTAQVGQPQFVDKLLNSKVNGFFVECGAYNGEDISNTLFFEIYRNWTGILIEVSSNHYQQLLTKKRHAYSLNACLSPVTYPKVFNYREIGGTAGLVEFHDKAHVQEMHVYAGALMAIKPSAVICYPLYSVMLAIGQNHIDYLSLDVEGAELAILSTIPFDKLRIEVILLEYLIMSSPNDTLAKLNNLRRFFNDTKLYKEVGTLGNLDVAFKRID
jgi:hypothetical protein